MGEKIDFRRDPNFTNLLKAARYCQPLKEPPYKLFSRVLNVAPELEEFAIRKGFLVRSDEGFLEITDQGKEYLDIGRATDI